MVRVNLPNGEIVEIHDPLLESVFALFVREREELTEALYAVTKERNPETLARARQLLHAHGKKDA